MYQSRISRTKKRSFEVNWEWSIVLCGYFSLVVVLTFALRTVLMPGSYGAVSLEIPVLSHGILDVGMHRFREEPRNYLAKTTPMVVLTSKAFYFGSMGAFSEDYADKDNKFVIPHQDGAPLLGQLIDSMERWINNRSKVENIPIDKILVFVPSGDIPVSIVTQVVFELKKSPLIGRVVMGSGLK